MATIKSKHRNGKSRDSRYTLVLLLAFLLTAYFVHNTRTLNKKIREEIFLDKIRLVDAVLAGRVFETSVNKLPVLSDLFKEYEKGQKYFQPGLNMKDYDESCDGFYEDSVSGDFDKEYYHMKEYEYKMVHKNKTDVKIQICETDKTIAPFGCCTACLIKDCCACQFDGKRNIIEEVLEPNKDVPFTLNSQINLGFGLMFAKEAKAISKKYGQAMTKLGYSGPNLKTYRGLKAWSYIPPGGFFMWHTNEYDNNLVPYRIYIISVDKDGESAFKYELPNGEKHEVKDFHGAVRLFKNTFDDPKTGEEKYLWHTVYSQAHRQSLGFEIRPMELVALLDKCDTCWEDIKQDYQEIYHQAYVGRTPF
jgi:hypothetical protein